MLSWLALASQPDAEQPEGESDKRDAVAHVVPERIRECDERADDWQDNGQECFCPSGHFIHPFQGAGSWTIQDALYYKL